MSLSRAELLLPDLSLFISSSLSSFSRETEVLITCFTGSLPKIPGGRLRSPSSGWAPEGLTTLLVELSLSELCLFLRTFLLASSSSLNKNHYFSCQFFRIFFGRILDIEQQSIITHVGELNGRRA